MTVRVAEAPGTARPRRSRSGRPAAWLVCAGLASLAAARLAAAGAAPPLREVGRIPLPGVEGRIDHLALDASGQRLFVAALGSGTVEVVDLARGARTGRIVELREPQGVLHLPSRGALLVTEGEGASLAFVADAALRPTARTALREDPDNLRRDPHTGRVWVGEGRGASGALAAVDPAARRVVAEVELGGHPESFQLEARGPRIFVNVPSLRAVLVVDRESRQVTARWPLPCAASYPMALDEANGRLFVACRRPAHLVVLDAASGRPVADVPAPGDADDVFLDAARARLYVSGGAGAVRVYAWTPPDRLKALGDVATASGARTSLFVPASGRLYVAAPRRDGRTAEVIVLEAAGAERQGAP